MAGMAGHRGGKAASPYGQVDPAVVEAMRQAVAEAEQESSRTATYLFWRTGQILEAAHGPGMAGLPSQRSLYRLLDKLSAGKHTTGSARTRRSLADRPGGPFGEADAWAPGEVMQMDSTPLDVLVRLDDGVTGRVDLTGMIDVATRTVTAAVLRPATKSVDASVLLARTVTPEPMRPGWADALAMSRSALPYQRLLDIDARMEHAAARPVIIPETIVVDHGKVFISRNFRASCNFLGINFQPVHEGSGWEKGHIERMLGSVASLFAQFVAGYTGFSVERRGHRVERQAAWSLLELQELLDEWIVAAFTHSSSISCSCGSVQHAASATSLPRRLTSDPVYPATYWQNSVLTAAKVRSQIALPRIVNYTRSARSVPEGAGDTPVPPAVRPGV